MPNPEFQHFKDGNVIYDVSDAVARSHIEDVLALTTSGGIHGMRYFSGTLSYYDSNTSEWVEIETGSGGIVELTAEEFAHLTEEEKNANVIYIITDALDGGTGELTGIFTGTHAQWNNLSDDDKALYSLVFFTDDYETTSSAFIGATSSADGVAGIVPKPLIADKDKFLKGDGTWAENSVGVIDSVPTENSNNLVTSGGVYNAIASIPTPTSDTPVDKTTTFNADGSITEEFDTHTVETTFNADGSITEVYTYTSGNVITKTTTFSGNEINEVVTTS